MRTLANLRHLYSITAARGEVVRVGGIGQNTRRGTQRFQRGPASYPYLTLCPPWPYPSQHPASQLHRTCRSRMINGAANPPLPGPPCPKPSQNAVCSSVATMSDPELLTSTSLCAPATRTPALPQPAGAIHCSSLCPPCPAAPLACCNCVRPTGHDVHVTVRFLSPTCLHPRRTVCSRCL